jgi:hypothetical protein
MIEQVYGSQKKMLKYAEMEESVQQLVIVPASIIIKILFPTINKYFLFIFVQPEDGHLMAEICSY